MHRSTEGGPFVLIDRLEFPATRYIDHGVEPGMTYTYQVTAIGDHQSAPCGTFQVSTVPELGSAWPVGAAAVLGATAFGRASRKRGKRPGPEGDHRQSPATQHLRP